MQLIVSKYHTIINFLTNRGVNFFSIVCIKGKHVKQGDRNNSKNDNYIEESLGVAYLLSTEDLSLSSSHRLLKYFPMCRL